MNKRFVCKTLCVLLVCVFAFTAVIPAFAGTPAEDAHLHFNKDGRFRILNFSDIQDDESLESRVKTFIREAVYTACPDLIVLTGDNIYGPDASGTSNTRAAIAEFMTIFQELGVPVAIVFGNHDDDDNGVSKETQMTMYNQYSVSISYDEGSSMDGCGTYNVPIYGYNDRDKVKFNLWMFDTGSSINNALSGTYDYMRQNQLDWYVRKSNELKAANGGVPVPSMAFQHIIVNEIYNALTPVSSGGVSFNGQNYVLPSTAKPGSVLGEHPCPSDNSNEKEFATIKQQGDVVAIVSGHDHKNCFVVPYQGVDLINSPAAGFYVTKLPIIGIVYQGDDATRGARIIDIYEEKRNGVYYDTEMLILRDLEKDEIYTPTGANVSIAAHGLRVSYFLADKKLKHLDENKKYREDRLAALEDAMAAGAVILADLNDDRLTSLYGSMEINDAVSNIQSVLIRLDDPWLTIYFDANGGTCDEEKRMVDIDSYNEASCGILPQAQREGYVFDGWFTEREGGALIIDEMLFQGPDDYTLYAHWTKDRTPGDMNNDGEVDLQDVVLVQRWLAGGWGVELEPAFADVNADGKLDLRDVMLLRRYLAGGWDVVLV